MEKVGSPLLAAAAAAGGNFDIVKLLVDHKANPKHSLKGCKKTALHFASEEGRAEIAQYLIEKGAKVDAKDKDDWRPLHYAASKGHTEIVQILVENEAKTNITNKNKRTPLILAADEDHFEIIDTLTEYW